MWRKWQPNAWRNWLGQRALRDAGITAGIATDKLLALSGDPKEINNTYTSTFSQWIS